MTKTTNECANTKHIQRDYLSKRNNFLRFILPPEMKHRIISAIHLLASRSRRKTCMFSISSSSCWEIIPNFPNRILYNFRDIRDFETIFNFDPLDEGEQNILAHYVQKLLREEGFSCEISENKINVSWDVPIIN